MPKFISDADMAKLEESKKFISDDEMLQLEQSKPSDLESGLRGAAQGATLNFADELVGGAQGLYDVTLGDKSLSQLPEAYTQRRDESRVAFEAAQRANPEAYLTGEIGGAIGSSLLVPNPATIGGRLAMAAGTGALAGAGGAKEDIASETLKGAALGGAGGAFGEALGAGLKKGAEYLAPKASKAAEFLAERSFGPTGKELSGLKEGTGRYLLDKGVVSFGDTAEKIAEKARSGMDIQGDVMNDVLRELESKGITVSQDNIVSTLQNRITAMADDPSMTAISKKLQGIVEDIAGTGQSNISPIKAEEIKRGFNKMAGNWMNPEVGQAGKEAYGAYKTAVESAAESVNSELASKFTEAKKAYGMLAPVEAAASRRANVTSTSPTGGLLDINAAELGQAVAGGAGMFAAPAARKILAPRATSAAAVTLDKVGKIMSTPPEKLGKFANILGRAAERGRSSVAITDYLLQQQNPEYRQLRQQLDEEQ